MYGLCGLTDILELCLKRPYSFFGEEDLDVVTFHYGEEDVYTDNKS